MSGKNGGRDRRGLSEGVEGYRDLFESVSICRRLDPECGWGEMAEMFEPEPDIEARKLAIGSFMTKALFEGSYEDLVAFGLIGARVLAQPTPFGEEHLTREKLLAIADSLGLAPRQ